MKNHWPRQKAAGWTLPWTGNWSRSQESELGQACPIQRDSTSPEIEEESNNNVSTSARTPHLVPNEALEGKLVTQSVYPPVLQIPGELLAYFE